MTSNKPDYTILDRAEVLARLFHPRKDSPHAPVGPGQDVTISVSSEAEINARFHWGQADWPAILFFHGNGEIVSDYDDLGPYYNDLGFNFLVVDYRGYGRSSGVPTVSTMMTDCHTIYDFTADWLTNNQHTGALILMGRSLGSASVLELAAADHHRKDEWAGLIIESGFAYAEPLLRLLGIHPESIGFREAEGFGNLNKIKTVSKPTLIIHAEYDHIIPYSDGQALYEASPAIHKELLKIPGANHNDIFYHGRDSYLSAIKNFATGLSPAK